VLEHDRRYVNLAPMCEPQLGRRGLYGSTGGSSPREVEMAMLWVLNLSDGQASLLDIAQRAEMPFGIVREAAERLQRHDLLAPAP